MRQIDWALVARYLNHTCTAEEARAVEAWAALDPSNAQTLDEARRIWTATGGLPESWDVPTGWRTLERELDADEGRTRAPLRIYRRTPRPASSRRPTWGISAAVLVIALGTLWSAVRPRGTVAPPATEYTTARGERATVKLSDGTEVLLGPMSRLTLAADYGRSTRDLSLEGEAYFAVTHDAAHPFDVHAHNAIVRDIGTQFDVRAYPHDRDVRVAVAEGRVGLRPTTGARAVLERPLQMGDVAVVVDTALAITHGADVTALTAWTRGELRFVNTPLKDVASELGRWYNLDIRVSDSTLAAQPVIASFANQSAESVLTSLTTVFGAHWTRAGDVIVIAPGPR